MVYILNGNCSGRCLLMLLRSLCEDFACGEGSHPFITTACHLWPTRTFSRNDVLGVMMILVVANMVHCWSVCLPRAAVGRERRKAGDVPTFIIIIIIIIDYMERHLSRFCAISFPGAAAYFNPRETDQLCTPCAGRRPRWQGAPNNRRNERME